MLIIRLNRIGKKNKPYFRVVVTEKSAAAQSGKFLEIVGSYDPHQKKAVFKEERVKHWLGCGAQTSDTVHNLLVKYKVIKGEKRKKKISVKKKEQPEEEVSQKEATQEETKGKQATEKEVATEKEETITNEDSKTESKN